MTPAIGPILVLVGAALALPGGRRKQAAQSWVSVVAGALALLSMILLDAGDVVRARFWGLDLVLVQVTGVQLVFGWAFSLALLAWGVYAWTLDDLVERGVGLIYAGCALTVVFAGDWLTLFLAWEGMAVASTVVVLRGRTTAAAAAAYRYLLVHLLGGVLLLMGIALVYGPTGGLVPVLQEGAEGGLFGGLLAAADGAGSTGLVVGAWLVLVGFLVNAAAWPLSAWLPDAYPQASPTGTVLLGTFTTKTAVYVLIVSFAGAQVLTVLGALMALYAVVYALGTRDIRRLLAYSLVGQVGFMLCAAGVGGPAGVTGAASHAFMHVLYKSLLFMAAGAVVLTMGRSQGRTFDGLWRRMPVTFLCAAVGAATIAALPLTSAFVSKSYVLAALEGAQGRSAAFAQTALLIASAAAPLYVSLRFLWLAFTGPGKAPAPEAGPAPRSQRYAMGALAFLCVGLGVWSAPVMSLLPVADGVHVWTWAHVGKQLLLVGIGVVLFVGVRLLGARVALPHPPDPLPDTDRLYWRATAAFVAFVKGPLIAFFALLSRFFHEDVPASLVWVARNPAGFARLGFERVRLAGAALLGTDATVDRAQERFLRQRVLYRQTPPEAPWPIGRTVLFGILLLGISVLLFVLT